MEKLPKKITKINYKDLAKALVDFRIFYAPHLKENKATLQIYFYSLLATNHLKVITDINNGKIAAYCEIWQLKEPIWPSETIEKLPEGGILEGDYIYIPNMMLRPDFSEDQALPILFSEAEKICPTWKQIAYREDGELKIIEAPDGRKSDNK